MRLNSNMPQMLKILSHFATREVEDTEDLDCTFEILSTQDSTHYVLKQDVQRSSSPPHTAVFLSEIRTLRQRPWNFFRT